MAEYKLVIVVRESRELPRSGGRKPAISTTEEEVVTIGYFKTERELQQWAEDNLGEIEKD